MKTISLLSGASAAVIAAALMSGTAQAAPGTAATEVDQIIVTAQKRSENLQAVPISITAVSGETLAKSHITSVDDVQHYAPGLTIAAVGSGIVSYTYVRGGGTNQIDGGADPSVAYFVDEVYIGGSAGLQFDLFDVDHVEVLKGPQGTLFGRNAASGAISIVTKRPSSTFGGSLTADAGSYNAYGLHGGVTGPFGQDGKLLYRASFDYRRRDGFTENMAGADPGRINSFGGRGEIEYVGDKVTFLLSADGLNTRNGMTNQLLTQNKTSILSAAAIAALPATSFYKQSYNTDGFENQRLGDLTGRLEWKIPIGTFTSISAFRSNQFDRLQDQDSTIAAAYALGSHELDKTFSQEFRLVGSADNLHWVGGLYYYHAQSTEDWVAQLGPVYAVPVVQNKTGTDNSVITSNSYAAYAQATYDFTSQVSLTVGGRYTVDQKSDQRTVKGFLAPLFSVDPSARWHAFTPAVTLNYKVTPDVLTYLSYREGFKSGGFQTLLPGTAAIANTTFLPEKVKSYEAGVKSEWFDHRLLVDAALFRSDITNQQILRVTGGAGIALTVDNAGATRADGVDLAIRLRPTRGLHLDANMTFQKARFQKYVNGAVSYAGHSQLRSPDFTGSYSAEYDFDLDHGGQLAVRGEYSYESKDFFDAPNTQTNGLFQPAYGLANGRITYTPANGPWDLSLWGKNLGNTHYYRNIAVSVPTGIAVPGDPLTFGATLNLKFR